MGRTPSRDASTHVRRRASDTAGSKQGLLWASVIVIIRTLTTTFYLQYCTQKVAATAGMDGRPCPSRRWKLPPACLQWGGVPLTPCLLLCPRRLVRYLLLSSRSYLVYSPDARVVARYIRMLFFAVTGLWGHPCRSLARSRLATLRRYSLCSPGRGLAGRRLFPRQHSRFPLAVRMASAAAPASAGRTISRVVMAREQAEGDGARVRRSIGSRALPDLDPFLLLDEFRVTPPAGFPTHPHRGMQTVTYMLSGAFQHKVGDVFLFCWSSIV